MPQAATPRRGRPPKPTVHPVGGRMRERREALRLTVRDLALRVGLRESSASYLSQLESGAKTPNAALAARLAAALADEPGIYLAWAETGRRSDPVATARAVRLLADTLGHPAYGGLDAGPAPGRSAMDGPRGPGGATERSRVQPVPGAGPDATFAASDFPTLAPEAATTQARLLVPEIDESGDPGGDGRSRPEVRALHRVPAEALAGIEPPVRPFAFRLSAAGARRVGDALAPGDLAVVSRRAWPLERSAPYVIRLSGHLVASRALWNGRQLLLLPGRDESDFLVLDAPDRAALERLVVGKVVARVRGEE